VGKGAGWNQREGKSMVRRLRTFFREHYDLFIIVIVLLGIVAIAAVVRYKLSFLNFFFLPVILAGYFLGKNQGVLTAFLCVLLMAIYLFFLRRDFSLASLSSDEIVSLTTWAGFLILTGGIVGAVSDQRQAKMRHLSQAYIGALDVMLKYLESADEERPHAVRVALLAGRLAEKLQLNRREIENIKSAALLLEAGDMEANLRFFEEAATFIQGEIKKPGGTFSGREMVMLNTTASLLKEIKPIMDGYYQHYVREAEVMDKNFEAIPLASSLIALADTYDRLSTRIYPASSEEKITSLLDLQKVGGRFFPEEAVKALFDLIAASR